MANGEQRMANGEWRMTNGKWQMANGKWQMANGEQCTVNSKWRTANSTYHIEPMFLNMYAVDTGRRPCELHILLSICKNMTQHDGVDTIASEGMFFIYRYCRYIW
jgi:hypothetical protein